MKISREIVASEKKAAKRVQVAFDKAMGKLPELTWYASAAIDCGDHEQECYEQYGEELKSTVEKSRDDDET